MDFALPYHQLWEPNDVMAVHRRSDNGAWEVLIRTPGQAPIRRSNKAWSQLDALNAERELLAAPRLLTDALDKWIGEYVPFLSHTENYKQKAELLRPLLKDKLLTEGPTIPSLMRKAWPTLEPATINRRLAILRRILNLAFNEWHWLVTPLGSKIKLLPERNRRHYYLTHADVERLQVACPDKEVADLILFSALTGLRQSEMFRTCKTQIINDCLHVPPHTKNGMPRTIPLHPRALLIAQQLPYAVSMHRLRNGWEAARHACSLDHIHWHDLRHTFASWLLQTGASLTEVKDLLGHSTITETMRYAHLAHNNHRGAIDRL